jgi:hypothetical protein
LFFSLITDYFSSLLPNKTMTFKGEKCHGGKRSKERITVALCTNFDGTDKRRPIVIGRSQNPRWMKKMKQPIPVLYRANKSAWMTTNIFEDWLLEWNRQLRTQNRRIILILDNCTAHSHPTLSNIKLHFLPPNCTSKLQPLDLGIIKNFKVYYRRSMLDEILLTLEKDATAIPSFTVGQAITLMTNAWRQVTSTTIQNCWLKALPSLKQHKDFSLAPLEDISANDENWTLVDQEMSVTWEIVIGQLKSSADGSDTPVLNDFLHVDDDVDVCSEYEITEQIPENDVAAVDVEEVEDVEDTRVPTLVEALQSLQQLETFCFYEGLADDLGKHTDKIHRSLTNLLANKNTKQSVMTDFFNLTGRHKQ